MCTNWMFPNPSLNVRASVCVCVCECVCVCAHTPSFDNNYAQINKDK